MPGKPLEGIRVLTLEQFGAGPYGTMFLAELGAEVIKVEAPDGDPSRQVGPYKLGKDDSEYFQAWNLGKKSVTIDMKSAEGRRQFEALVKTADCVVNNLRGTQPAKLAIDYASLNHLKPSIVCLHISAYGRANERKDWPGYDFLMQAEAGLMELTGEPDGAPTRVGVSMIDSMSGLTGIVGLLSCLLRARATALRHPSYSSSRRLEAIAGVNVRSTVQREASASSDGHTPTPSPARYAAPSAVVSITDGRRTLTPMRLAWNWQRKSFAVAPPSTRSASTETPASAVIASSTSRL